MTDILVGLTGVLSVLLLLVGALAIIPMMAAMFFGDLDAAITIRGRSIELVPLFLMTVVTGLILGIVMLGVNFALSPASPELVDGRCYQAVRHERTTLLPVVVGKTTVIIPSHTSGIDLVEVRCG